MACATLSLRLELCWLWAACMAAYLGCQYGQGFQEFLWSRETREANQSSGETRKATGAEFRSHGASEKGLVSMYVGGGWNRVRDCSWARQGHVLRPGVGSTGDMEIPVPEGPSLASPRTSRCLRFLQMGKDDSLESFSVAFRKTARLDIRRVLSYRDKYCVT